MGVDTDGRDTRTEIFGHQVSAPIGFAPIGINQIYHEDGEPPVAQVAGELNLLYCLSTAGSYPIEDVGKANGPNGVRFFQLYMPRDDELTVPLLTRANEVGFTACILTLDTPQLGWRHQDIATSNYAFYGSTGASLGLTDPIFSSRLRSLNIDQKTHPADAATLWIDTVRHGRAHLWSKVAWVKELWKKRSQVKPSCVKGIQSVKDAETCVQVGVDGIVFDYGQSYENVHFLRLVPISK
ncbi:hypothetical protein HDV00_004612 [Rhizophlyctis rosea]|nr:hypothetical protein HDV00_004612 [Rhizophlyctis rosea]